MKNWWNARSTVAKVVLIVVAVIVVAAAVFGGEPNADDRAVGQTTTSMSATAPDSTTTADSSTTTTTETTTSTTSPPTTTTTVAPPTTSTTSTTTSTTQPATTTTTDPSAALRFDPFEVTGSGDDVVDLAIPEDLPAVLELSHSGTSNFAVLSHTADGDRIDLLVNEIGSYSGSRPINLYSGEEAGFLEITADSRWTIRAVPITDIPTFETSASGQGDAVLFVTGGGGRLSLTHNGESNFAVLSHGASRDLLVNEIGPYEGRVLLDSGAVLIDITADGDWTLELG